MKLKPHCYVVSSNRDGPNWYYGLQDALDNIEHALLRYEWVDVRITTERIENVQKDLIVGIPYKDRDFLKQLEKFEWSWL